MVFESGAQIDGLEWTLHFHFVASAAPAVMKPLIHKKILEKELEGFGIRVNKEPPNIYYRKKEKGMLTDNVERM